jgi:putative hydrolase of the HAD superfamily
MIFVFDLDSTLYDELDFVRGGLIAVATYLSPVLGEPVKELYEEMWSHFLSNGRGHIFDAVLRSHGRFSKVNVARCISAYRLHQHNLALYPDAERCLKRFNSTPLYIVTDGNKVVQTSKIDALGLHNKVKKAFVTHRHGRHRSKPSTYCFEKIAQLERAPYSDIAYIGDDPNKDFVNLKPLGIRTVRILRGPHQHLRLDKAYEAEFQISTLDELTESLFQAI